MARQPIIRGHRLPAGVTASRGTTSPITVQRVMQINDIPEQDIATAHGDITIEGTWRFVPVGTDEVTELAVGDLNGDYGYVAATYGVAIGEYATGRPNITIDDVNGLRIRNYTTNVLTLDLAGNASFAGAVTAASGTIGGWAIGAADLTGGDAKLASAGKLTLGAVNDVVVLDAADANYRLWAGNAVGASAPFSVTKAGVLRATGATIEGALTATTGELVDLDVSGVLDLVSGGAIQSDNYSAGMAGWRVNHDGSAEFGDITARGTLKATVFEKGQVSATAGSLYITKSAGKLAADYTVDGTLTIETPDSGGFLFETNDIVRITAFNTAGSLTTTWIAVTRTGTTNVYTTAYASGTSGVTYPAGSVAVDYGASGDGLLVLTADDANGPFYSVQTHAGAPYTTLTERVRIGNLNGSFGRSSDLYGIGVGDYDAGNYLRYDPAGGFIMKAGSGAVQIDADGFAITPQTDFGERKRSITFEDAGQLWATALAEKSLFLTLGDDNNTQNGGISISAANDGSYFRGYLLGAAYASARWSIQTEARLMGFVGFGDLYQTGSNDRVPLVDRVEVMKGNASVWDSADLGPEVLTSGDFADASKWARTGDFAIDSGAMAYRYATGSGSFRQVAANLTSPLMGDTWYRLQYTLIALQPIDASIAVDASVSISDATIGTSPGTKVLYFRTVANPTDFVISATSTASFFAFDNLSLKPIAGGDLRVYGGVNVGHISAAPAGNIRYSGNLQSAKNNTVYSVYGAHFLTTQLTSTSWNGDSKTNSDNGVIDLSAVFGVPAGVKAVLCGVTCYSTTGGIGLVLKPDSDASNAPPINLHTIASTYQGQSAWVPCDANGDVYFSSDSATAANVWIEIWGYAI